MNMFGEGEIKIKDIPQAKPENSANMMKAFDKAEKKVLSQDYLQEWLGRNTNSFIAPLPPLSLPEIGVGFEKDVANAPETKRGKLLYPDVLYDTNVAYAMNDGAGRAVNRMLTGGEINGNKGLGLKEINKWKINPDFVDQNIKQHAGFAAEVISVIKENLKAAFENTGTTTHRADDLPHLFKKNDQYVDKVRMDKNGNIIERVQMKFVGDNPKECLSKLMSKKYDKYYFDGKVDKMEIPKEYYPEIKKELIPAERAKLQRQLDRVTADGKTDVAAGIKKRMERLDKIDGMLEQSSVSIDEARYAVLHPKRYANKLFVSDVVKSGNEIGKETGKQSMIITGTISTLKNLRCFIEGDCTAEEAVKNTLKDTTKSGALGYGTGFISGSVSRAMSQSSHQLIRSASKIGIPGAVVSLVVDSFDSIVDFGKGEIQGKELVKDIGCSAAGIAGSMGAAAAAGAALGSIVPGAGTAVGALVGIASSMAGYALATQGYKTALEYGPKGAEALLGKCSEIADNTIKLVKEQMPEKVNEVRAALTDFNRENGIPVKI